MSKKRFWALFMGSVFILSCTQNHEVISTGERNQLPSMPLLAQVLPMEWFFSTQQDVLPGMESNLRKQRLYRLEGTIPAEEGDDWLEQLMTMDQWELWVDGVVVPMRLIEVSVDMGVRLSGSRYYYHQQGDGRFGLEELQYAPAPWKDPAESAVLLVARQKGEMWCSLLDSLEVLPLLAAP